MNLETNLKALNQNKTRTFGQIVWEFLADRRCAIARSTLGKLYTEPDFFNVYENHLRCCALLAQKPAATQILELELTQVDEDWGDPCQVFTTRASWKTQPIQLNWLYSKNIFGHSIWETVKQFRKTGQCDSLHCDRFMKSHDWEKSGFTIRNCQATATIWMKDPQNANLGICLEGNKRLHSLVWQLQSSNKVDLEGWTAWIKE